MSGNVSPQPYPRAAAAARARAAAFDPGYRLVLDCSGSHTDGAAAGTYALGQGDPLAASGVGILYPLNLIYLDPADYPAIGSLAAKLRLRAELAANDVAPGCDFTLGLHPVTRPASSGGAGVAIYSIGAALAGSTITFTAPAADALLTLAGTDFDVPVAGHYAIGCVTSAPVAALAHVHLSAQLQARHA